jgi:hypothetical protein
MGWRLALRVVPVLAQEKDGIGPGVTRLKIGGTVSIDYVRS